MSRLKSLSPLGVALVISLVANALLIGLFLGSSFGKPPSPRDRGPRGGGEEFMLARGLESVVPEEAREEMRDTFRDTFRSSRELWEAKHAAREALKRALAEQPFSQAAVNRAFADMRAADEALTERFQSALSNQFEMLTQEQRDALVARLEEIEARRQRWREHHRHDGPPPGPAGGEGLR